MRPPTGRREALEQLTRRGVSQRAAYRYLGLSRRLAQYTLQQPGKDRALGEQLMATAQAYPRFGYRRSAAWLDLWKPSNYGRVSSVTWPELTALRTNRYDALPHNIAIFAIPLP